MPYKDKEKAKANSKKYYQNHKKEINKKKEPFKIKLHELKIDGCSKCGYHKNDAALDFHHIDPKTKKFNLGINCFTKHSEEEIREELNKCILLCANCHTRLHNQKEK